MSLSQLSQQQRDANEGVEIRLHAERARWLDRLESAANDDAVERAAAEVRARTVAISALRRDRGVVA